MTELATSVQVRQVIAAPRHEVFEAFTQPDQLHRWWGPEGFIAGSIDVDLRVGGGYRFEMRPPVDGAPSMVVAGTYEEVDPPARLAFTWRWERSPMVDEPASFVTVDFLDRDGDTEVVVTHGRFPADHDLTNYTSGWEDGLRKVAALLRRA